MTAAYINLSELKKDDSVLEIVESKASTNDEFKDKVAIPYFKDIFKVRLPITPDRDLRERSESPDKGLDRLSFVNYCNLPGILVDRLFALI